MFDPSTVRFEGPLEPHRDKLWAHFLAEGYAPLSGRNLLLLGAHLSRWLAAERLDPDCLSMDRVDAFLHHRRESGYVHYFTRRSLRPLLSCLRSEGVVPEAEEPATSSSPVDELLDSYGEYLVEERGLTASVVEGYRRSVRRFLSNRFGEGALRPEQLTSEDVSSFVLREARSHSIGYAKLKVSALRSFLRFLHVRGLADDLVAAVPSVAGWRLSGLPKSLTPTELRNVLRSSDRRTHVGRRDYAILLVLARLGLRVGEVARLRLDDVNWDLGELIVRGKGSREDRLPLPCDVGEAVASYLKRSRPDSVSRRLFLQIRAPFRDLARGTVTALVYTAFSRAGVAAAGGAHRLRHTAAVQMLRHGASLPEIAQVLRHQSLETTAIYAKVDREALRGLALPWPGGES